MDNKLECVHIVTDKVEVTRQEFGVTIVIAILISVWIIVGINYLADRELGKAIATLLIPLAVILAWSFYG